MGVVTFFSMEHMNAFAMRGTNGDPIATPSICSKRCPLNWKSWSFVAMLSSLTKSSLLIFRLWVLLNQLSLNALSAKIQRYICEEHCDVKEDKKIIVIDLVAVGSLQ